jgi:hypothetical protein
VRMSRRDTWRLAWKIVESVSPISAELRGGNENQEPVIECPKRTETFGSQMD